jgi:hypothetical protein
MLYFLSLALNNKFPLKCLGYVADCVYDSNETSFIDDLHLSVKWNVWRHDTLRLRRPEAVPLLRPLVAWFSPQRLGFVPRPVCVEFVVDKMILRPVFLRILSLSSASIIPPLLLCSLGTDNGPVTGRSSARTVSFHTNGKKQVLERTNPSTFHPVGRYT